MVRGLVTIFTFCWRNPHEKLVGRRSWLSSQRINLFCKLWKSLIYFSQKKWKMFGILDKWSLMGGGSLREMVELGGSTVFRLLLFIFLRYFSVLFGLSVISDRRALFYLL